MPGIAVVKASYYYGGKKSNKRTINFPVRIEGAFDGVDYKDKLTAIAVALKPFTTDQTTVGRVTITQLKEADNLPIPDNAFQSQKTNEVGTVVQGNVKDAALREIVGVFEGNVMRGRAPQYHFPYFIVEDNLAADKNLDPEALGLTVQTINTNLALLYTAVKAIGTPCVFGTNKNGKNRRTGSRDVEKFIYVGVMNKSLPGPHKDADDKLLAAVKSRLSEINADVRRETSRIAGTSEKFDPALLAEAKAAVEKLIADSSAALVRRAKIPYPLNTIVATPA